MATDDNNNNSLVTVTTTKMEKLKNTFFSSILDVLGLNDDNNNPEQPSNSYNNKNRNKSTVKRRMKMAEEQLRVKKVKTTAKVTSVGTALKRKMAMWVDGSLGRRGKGGGVDDVEEGNEIWRKRILMGQRCHSHRDSTF